MAFYKVEKAPEIPEERMKELLFFQESIGIKFNDISILNNAFIHSSYANEVKNEKVCDNERLEFLGDSVLSIVVSTWLYDNLKGDEGDCTKVRSAVVSEDSLSIVAKKLELDRYLIIGKGEELTGGRFKKAILADCTEAVFAAIFLDQGMEVVRKFILGNLMPIIGEVMNNGFKRDYKTMLQEYAQKRYKKVPVYALIKSVGPEHDQIFYYTVSIHGQTFGPEGGHNKKDAEQNVAKLAWEQLTKQPTKPDASN
jgi:ribonuclease III